MAKESEVKRAEVSKKSKDCEDLMEVIKKERKQADEQQAFIEKRKIEIGKDKIETEHLAAEADAELKKAEPALISA
jgi:membrane-bound lytic murein transglycosylase B